MRYLLDSHLLIWNALYPERLPKAAVPLLNDENNELYFSAASMWEVSVKAERHRSFEVDPRVLLRNLKDIGYIELPLTSQHAMAVIGLPMVHRDPFDRILVAQSIVEGITLLTADETLTRYPGPIRKV